MAGSARCRSRAEPAVRRCIGALDQNPSHCGAILDAPFSRRTKPHRHDGVTADALTDNDADDRVNRWCVRAECSQLRARPASSMASVLLDKYADVSSLGRFDD